MTLIQGFEKEYIIDKLYECEGRVYLAAQKLCMAPRTLYYEIDLDLDLQQALKTAKNYAKRKKVEESETYFEERMKDKRDKIHGWKSAHYYLTNYESDGTVKKKEDTSEDQRDVHIHVVDYSTLKEKD